jgi:hypothetical protein
VRRYASYAASLPLAATTTVSSISRGELEKPHMGTSVLLSTATFRDQILAPRVASSALRIPVAPNA